MTENKRIGQYWVSLCYLSLGDGIVRVTCGEGDYCIGYRFSHEAFNMELGSRKMLEKEQLLSALTNKGVYFLVFRNERGTISKVYVGKAGERADEKLGVINRIREHCRDKYRNWDEAVVLTWRDNSLNATRVSFLEHEFHDMIKRFYGEEMLSNDVTPSSSTPGERELNDLEKFASMHAPRMLAALGYTFLEERKPHKKFPAKRVGKVVRVDAKRSENASKKDTTKAALETTESAFWVRFGDGTVIHAPKAKTVFAKAIEKMGVDKVARLGMLSLLSRNSAEFGDYANSALKIGAWFLNTHSSTNEKMRRLRGIALRLGLDVEMGRGAYVQSGHGRAKGVSAPEKVVWKGKTQLAKLIARREGNEGAYGGILQYFAEEGTKVRRPCPSTSKWRKPLEAAGVEFDSAGYVVDWSRASNPL